MQLKGSTAEKEEKVSINRKSLPNMGTAALLLSPHNRLPQLFYLEIL
jgi:hypothetical protein